MAKNPTALNSYGVRERAAGALRRVAARWPSNNVPHWTSGEPSQIGRQLSVAAAGDALILNFLKDTSAAS